MQVPATGGLSDPNTSVSDRRPPVGSLADRAWSAFDRRFFKIAAIPAFLVVFAVTVVPMLAGLGLSFSSISSTHNAILPATLANYRALFSDDQIRTVLTNTLVFVVLSVSLEIALGLILALLLSQRGGGISVFRVIFLLPLTVAGIAAAISWSALLNTSQGWINYFLSEIGLPQPNWLASPKTAMLSVVITDLWSGVPVVAVLVLAALLGAPRDPIEAAMVDGASAWQRFRYVTFPAIRPALALATLLRVVAAFQQFALFQVLTGGGPGLDTTVINFYVYQQTIVYNNIGYGAALAVLVVVVMAVPLIGLFIWARR